MDVFTKEKWHQTTLHLSFSLFEKKKKNVHAVPDHDLNHTRQ